MRAHAIHRGAWRAALLVLGWSAAAAAGEPPRLALPGIGLGMTPEAVTSTLAAQGEAAPTAVIRRPDHGGSGDHVQRVFHELRDGRSLQVVFAPRQSGNGAVEITLADPQASDAAALRAEAERLYGPPAAVLPVEGGRGFIAAWHGTAETQGAIRPLPGAATTLRLEFIPDVGSNLRLTRHRAPDVANRPAAGPLPGAPAR